MIIAVRYSITRSGSDPPNCILRCRLNGYSQWEITEDPGIGIVRMRTESSYLSYAYELERTAPLTDAR